MGRTVGKGKKNNIKKLKNKQEKRLKKKKNN